MREIRTMPDRFSDYPCFERFPSGVAVWVSFTSVPRYLTHEQFDKEFKMAKRQQKPPEDPSMRAAALDEPMIGAQTGTPSEMELVCTKCGTVDQFPGDIMPNQPCSASGCGGRMTKPESAAPAATAEPVDGPAQWAQKIHGKFAFLQPGKCQSCGAPVLWAKTAAGANMILDPAARPLQVLAIDEEGQCVRTVKALGSHWATCPQSASHKKS